VTHTGILTKYMGIYLNNHELKWDRPVNNSHYKATNKLLNETCALEISMDVT
jgi:hypothetical protein